MSPSLNPSPQTEEATPTSPTLWRRTRRRWVALFLLLTIPVWFAPPWEATQAGTKPNRYTAQIFYTERGRLTQSELLALEKFRPGETLAARNIAEKILSKRPYSYVAHFLMYFTLRNDEGELIRSLWHLRQAINQYKSQVQVSRSRSHHMMLIELISVLRQLGRERESLKLITQHDRLYSIYSIKYEEYRPWILMKMRRYKQARKEALAFLSKKKYKTTALNSLCAISFERNHRQESLKYCLAAYKADLERRSTYNRSVHSINLAEAYLSVFDLGQSEQFAFKATRHFHKDLHSTPWEFLLGLYLAQGRYNDAWNALRRSKSWFNRQAPKLAESVYASNQLAQASFLLGIARPKIALNILERIRDRPDRHGHMSAQTRQFVAGARLLRRHALLMRTETLREKAASKGFAHRMGTWFQTLWYRFRAWRQGALLRRQMADPEFLHNSISPYRSGSFSMPNSPIPHWYSSDLIGVMGPAIVRKALEHVRAGELKSTPKVNVFLQALEAEIAYRRGEYKQARAYSFAVLEKLPRSLVPLRVRMHAIQGAIAYEESRYSNMREAFAYALQKDGSVFRRYHLALPVAAMKPQTPLARRVLDALLRSPRFVSDPKGFLLRIDDRDPMVVVYLTQRNGTVISRVAMLRSEVKPPSSVPKTSLKPKSKAKPQKAKKPTKPVKYTAEQITQWFVEQLSVRVHRDLFAPAIQLSKQDIFSLDGTPLQNNQPILKLPSFFKNSSKKP